MQSEAKMVSEYLREVPRDRLEALKKLRALCRKELKGYKETMRYGMPSYELNGVAEVSFNSQKNYIALYILKQDVLDAHRRALKGISTGKSCIRYAKPGKIDFDLVKKMLTETWLSEGRVC